MNVTIRNDTAAGVYELYADDELAATTSYVKRGDQIVLPHTVTDPRFRGQGLAGQVVRRALDDARAEGLTVVPSCWFVARYIDQHAEYADLVAA